MWERELVRQVGITDGGQEGSSMCDVSVMSQDTGIKTWIALIEPLLLPVGYRPAVLGHPGVRIRGDPCPIARNVPSGPAVSELDPESLTGEDLSFDLTHSWHMTSFMYYDTEA